MEGRSWTICRGFVARIPSAPTMANGGGKNLSVCDHYGPNQERRTLRCKTCKTRFSEPHRSKETGDSRDITKAHIAVGCQRSVLYCERADVSRFSSEKDSFLPAQSIVLA
jgi:hypothetical protein